MNRIFIRAFLLTPVLSALFTINIFAQANFVYVNNNPLGPNSVTAFSVAPNGSLTPIAGSPFPTGGAGMDPIGTFPQLFAQNRAAICSVGSRLYVINIASNDVSGFDINPVTGALALIPGSPFPIAGITGASITCTPDGKFLIAAGQSPGRLAVFSIAADGSLAPVVGSPFVGTGTAAGIKVTNDGRFLVVADRDHGVIGVYSIAPDGTLTPVPGSPFSAASSNETRAGIEINCAGSLVFVGIANFGDTIVEVFSMGSNGALTPVPGSPFILDSGNNSNVVLLSPDERFLFVSNQFSGTITVLSVAPNGFLSAITGSPFSDGRTTTPQQMATNREGTLLYVNNSDGAVSVFSIAGDGALSPAAGSRFFAGSGSTPGIAAFPPRTCVSAPPFDICLQDDYSRSILRINSTTGAYEFTDCQGITLSGAATVSRLGETVYLQHFAGDRIVNASVGAIPGFGSATITSWSLGRSFSITDSNITNNTCGCQ